MKPTHVRIADRLDRLDGPVEVELNNGRVITVFSARRAPPSASLSAGDEPQVFLVNEGQPADVPRDFFRSNALRRLLNPEFRYVEIGPEEAVGATPWRDTIGTAPGGHVVLAGVVLNRLVGGLGVPNFGAPGLGLQVRDALLVRKPLVDIARIPILTCELCADLGCGYTAVEAERDSDGYAWHWLGPSWLPEGAPSPWRRFRFERAEYEAFAHSIG